MTIPMFMVGFASVALALLGLVSPIEAHNMPMPTLSMGKINREAERQRIEKPEYLQSLTIYSKVANGYLSVGDKTNSEGEKKLKIKKWRGHKNNVFIRSVTRFDKLVSFITNQGLANKTEDFDGQNDAERLVRSNNNLVAKVSNESEGALFMLKRYPPVCDGNTIVNSTKPQYVQLMLVDRNLGEYHRALLQVSYNQRNLLRFKLLKSTSGEDDCESLQNPSIVPGTLFMLKYN